MGRSVRPFAVAINYHDRSRHAPARHPKESFGAITDHGCGTICGSGERVVQMKPSRVNMLGSGLLLLHSFVMLPAAQALEVTDLSALVQEAVAKHPAILNANKLADAAASDVAYAERQRYPELSISALSQSQGTAAAIVVKQPIWAGGAIEAGEAVAQASEQAQQINAQEQALGIAMRVTEAWQNYFLARSKLSVVNQGIAQLEEMAEMMRRRVDAQISPAAEYELARARVMQAQVARASLQAERDLAFKRMTELVGDQLTEPDANATTRLEHWLKKVDQGVSPLTPAELDLVARYQPSVRRVQAEAQVASAEVRQIQAREMPSVFLQYQQGVNQAIANDKRLGLAMEYTPGRGLSSRQQVHSAVARAQARDFNIQTAVRDATDTLNAKLQELRRTAALQKTWRPAVNASEQLLMSYQRQFIAGRKTWQDVLSQHNDLIQGRQSLEDARVRWLGAFAQLQLMLGAQPGKPLAPDGWLDQLVGDGEPLGLGHVDAVKRKP